MNLAMRDIVKKGGDVVLAWMQRTHAIAEFKARCSDLGRAARLARAAGAHRVGRERQLDTYYNAAHGRLKVREVGRGAILAWYFRGDALHAKRSDVIVLPLVDTLATKTILARELGVKVVVDKVRRIYLKQNVRVHLDEVRGLGTFVEIESVGTAKDFPRLKKQAEAMARTLELEQGDLVQGSYSDLLFAKPRSVSRPPRRKRA